MLILVEKNGFLGLHSSANLMLDFLQQGLCREINEVPAKKVSQYHSALVRAVRLLFQGIKVGKNRVKSDEKGIAY